MLALLSAALAALAAHVGIDILGDYLLAHDTYDTIGHGSRTIVSCAAVAVLAAALLALVCSAVEERRAVRGSSHPRIGSIGGVRASGVFFALVLAATVGLLIAMEAGDLILAGQSIGDLDDLLGGSIRLGAAVTVLAALCSASAVRHAARWATTAHVAALRILDALLALRPRTARRSRLSQRADQRQLAAAPALSRSASKRGPPLRTH